MEVTEISGGNAKGPEELLRIVLTKYKLSPESLSKITGVDADEIRNMANSADAVFNFSISKKPSFDQLILMLSIGMESVSVNSRVKGIIETLGQVYNISIETISLYSEVSTDSIQCFMNNYDSISYEEKYRLAVTSLFLHYLFKQ